LVESKSVPLKYRTKTLADIPNSDSTADQIASIALKQSVQEDQIKAKFYLNVVKGE
jgi:hypothetical protein